jgi:hypothetical protein
MFNNIIYTKRRVNIKLAKLITPSVIKFLTKYINKILIIKKSKKRIYINILLLIKISTNERNEKSNNNHPFLPIKHFIIFSILFFFYFINLFPINLGGMSHNVPAVYDVLDARISKRKGDKSILNPPLRLQGVQNVGEVSRGNERSD